MYTNLHSSRKIEKHRDLEMSHADINKSGCREPTTLQLLGGCPGEPPGPQGLRYLSTAHDSKKTS